MQVSKPLALPLKAGVWQDAAGKSRRHRFTDRLGRQWMMPALAQKVERP